jgi:hypothetical protein
MLGIFRLKRDSSSNIAMCKGIFPLPAVMSLTTAPKSRLSDRISAHLNSSKLRNPETMPRAISKFITHHPWSVTHVAGSDEVFLHNTVDARAIDIRWSIIPVIGDNFSPLPQPGIPFTISVSDKLTPQGIVFRCRTRRTSSFRYAIERVGCYTSFPERDSSTSYAGPHFATLEPELQMAFDEVLHAWGMNTEVVDFIEASSQYYNNLEYINWLCNINDFISK